MKLLVVIDFGGKLVVFFVSQYLKGRFLMDFHFLATRLVEW